MCEFLRLLDFESQNELISFELKANDLKNRDLIFIHANTRRTYKVIVGSLEKFLIVLNEILYRNFKKIKSSQLFRYNMALIFASGLFWKRRKRRILN
ncbi:hypothetical protein FHG67_13605 [Leptospira weilii]|nr:hypothetical protein FHG67_13605 [Leptospira weilii]